MTINIEVSSGFRQSQYHSLKVFGQNNLTTQSRVIFEEWRHVQHVIFLFFWLW